VPHRPPARADRGTARSCRGCHRPGGCGRPNAGPATGGFRQRAGVEQHHHAGRFLIGLGHCLANGFDQGFRRQDFLHAAADFCGDADAFQALVIHRKCRDTPLAHHFHFALDGLLDVLRVQVVPAHDQQVFQAPGDKHLAVADKAQVTGAQPGATGVLYKRLGGGFGVAASSRGQCSGRWPRSRRRSCRPARRESAARRSAPACSGWLVPQLMIAVPCPGSARLAASACSSRRNAGMPCHGCRRRQTGRFGQAIGGEEVVRGKTPRGELLGEALQGVETDRLGTGIGHAPRLRSRRSRAESLTRSLHRR
jgi:hypothetical protein